MSRSECEAIAEELVAYADGELDHATHGRVDAHVGVCLACRRELSRLAKVDAALRGLPRLEPSADFAERLRERLEREAAVEPVGRRPWVRAAQWGLPALAAAAAVAIVLRSTLVPPAGDTPERFDPAPIAIAPDPAPVPEPPARVADAPAPKPAPAEVASVPGTDLADVAPEDLPPELLEQPEFFLRLPVVRRLEKLEHFDQVRQHTDPAGTDGSVG